MPWTDASGVSIRYEVSGRGDRSLILVHELGGSLESWDAIVPAFEDQWRVLRIDQRGAGLSEKVREPFSIEDHARDMDAAVTASRMTPPFVVAGIAGGAAIALLFASRRGAELAAAIFGAPSVVIADERKVHFRERAALAARAGMRAIIEPTLAAAYPDVVRRDLDAFEAYRSRFLANDPVGYGLNNLALAAANVEHLASSLACRCLVLAGAHDSLRPPARARELADRIPGAEFDVVDAGHFMHVQSPHVVAARMRAFLEPQRV